MDRSNSDPSTPNHLVCNNSLVFPRKAASSVWGGAFVRGGAVGYGARLAPSPGAGCTSLHAGRQRRTGYGVPASNLGETP